MSSIPFRKYKAIIFDVDGTMVDNVEYHRLAWKKFIENHQLPLTQETLERFIRGGVKNDDILKDYYGPSITTYQIQSYAEEKEQYYRELYEKHIIPVKGLIECIEYLHKIQIPLAIASSAMQKNIDLIIDTLNIRKYFSVVINGDEVKKGKPDPEIFLLAAKKLHIEPDFCLVFEDAISGINAAHRAGMDIAAVLTVLDEKQASIADYRLNNFSEIM